MPFESWPVCFASTVLLIKSTRIQTTCPSCLLGVWALVISKSSDVMMYGALGLWGGVELERPIAQRGAGGWSALTFDLLFPLGRSRDLWGFSYFFLINTISSSPPQIRSSKDSFVSEFDVPRKLCPSPDPWYL